MTDKNHDTLVYRLAGILIKLNAGEPLCPSELAAEFNVTLRTIQRDLNDRLSYLPIERSEGRYRLHTAHLGKLNTRDIERFASLAGVKGLFPSLDDKFLRGVFQSSASPTAWIVKEKPLENISARSGDFQSLERAILAGLHVSFRYARKRQQKVYDLVAPYKLLHHNGIWYVAAVHANKLKTFALGRVSHLMISERPFKHDKALLDRIMQPGGIWIVDQPRREALLRIDAEVASFFLRRDLLPDQHLEAELPDGSIVLRSTYGHPTEVASIVKYWMPHVIVQHPPELRELVLGDARRYLSLHTS